MCDIFRIATELSRQDNQKPGIIFDTKMPLISLLDSVAGSRKLVSGTLVFRERTMSNRVMLEPAVTVRLLPCAECKIDTCHHKTQSGLWVCWCGAVYQGEIK